MQNGLRKFFESQQPKPLISELNASEDFWNNAFYSRPSELVRIAYLAILGREPDVGGIAHYTQRLEKERDFIAVLKVLLASEEFLTTNLQDKIKQDPIRSALSHARFNNLVRLKPLIPELEFIELAAIAAKISVLKNLSPDMSKSEIHLIFVYLDKKDHDTLLPVVKRLKEIKSPSVEMELLSTFDAINHYMKNYHSRFVFVGGIERVQFILECIGLDDLFIYMEHGVAPLKTYTYAPHYKRFSYSLLPGKLWCERLEALYPELKGKLHTVGYPKLDVKEVSQQDRLAYCEKFNLDAEKKIVLFAPTWSGGSTDAGIFNVRFLKGVDNVIAIPHDGDKKFSKALRDEGFPIYILKDEFISYHYSFADLLISDYSSTAIEFARIGKPVICINAPVYNDCDKSYIADGLLEIPYTPYRWNFCPVKNREDLKGEIAVLLERGSPPSTEELVRKMCDSYGEEATMKAVRAIASIIASEFGVDILAR